MVPNKVQAIGFCFAYFPLPTLKIPSVGTSVGNLPIIFSVSFMPCMIPDATFPALRPPKLMTASIDF